MSALDEVRRQDAELRRLPPNLWDRLRSDPLHAPEHLALAAAERHAPAAAEWVREKRAMYAVTPHDLALMAKKRHASIARFSGAAAGVGGFALLVPDLAATAWVQSRLVYFVAASYGYDPFDPMRPAEQLVLQELYATPAEARAALDGAGRPIAEAFVQARVGSDETLARRLAKMVGKRAGKRLGARMIPGLAVAVGAVGNERDTRALADRAIAFYGGETQASP